jgi:hypothetical protein
MLKPDCLLPMLVIYRSFDYALRVQQMVIWRNITGEQNS